ncbi:hypothetical protein EV291_105130 [Rhizobium sp. BK068]|nr:hypothetical protein EV291_105130 [Rhizobium sp. BK068]
MRPFTKWCPVYFAARCRHQTIAKLGRLHTGFATGIPLILIELLIDEAAVTRTVTVDFIARWDVDNNGGLVIGYEGKSDASSYMISTNVAFGPPSG